MKKAEDGGGALTMKSLGLQAQRKCSGDAVMQDGGVQGQGEEGEDRGNEEKEEGEVAMEVLVALMPQMRLERSHSEIEIFVKRRQLLGTYMGTPKAGASPQLPRTRSV